jgi:hypothetical protein
MTPQVTITQSPLYEKAKGKIKGWTLPFLVEMGEKIAPQAANSQVITNEKSVSVARTSPTAFSDEFGSSTTQGDNALSLAVFALKSGGIK